MPTVLEQRIGKKLAIDRDRVNLESAIDRRLGIVEEPPVIDPEAERKKINNAIDISDELELPLSDVNENYNTIMEIPDPDDVPLGIKAPKEHMPDEKPYEGLRFEAAPPKTTWQKIKGFFVSDRPPLPPNADRMEKLDRAFDIAIGTPLRTFLKFAKGKTLGAGELMWAGIKRITPDDIWADEVKNMTLDEAMDWAAGYNPSGFVKMTGEIAEFIGRLQTAKTIGIKTGLLGKTPTDISALMVAGETAKLFGIAAVAEQISKAVATKIGPTETEYGYEGPKAVLRDMTIGAVLGFARFGVTALWGKLTPTEHTRALKLLGLKKGASIDEINAAARRLALKYHPDKAKGFISEFQKMIKARDLLRQGEVKDIIFRGQKVVIKPKLLPGEVAKPTVKPTEIVKKPPVTPTKPIKPEIAPITLKKPVVKPEVAIEPEVKFEVQKPPEQPEATATLTDEQSTEMLSGEAPLLERAKESLQGMADAAHRAHDWIFAFGEAKRTMPKLYDQLMKSFGKRNAGIERAIGEIERIIGPEGLNPEDATELSMVFEDKRLSPPDRLKDTYDRFSKLFAEIEKTSQAEGIFEKPFQERMLEEINGQIEAELFKLRSVGKGDSKKLKELLAEEDTIKNMRYLPHNIVAQKAIEAKLTTLTGEKRKTFLQNLSRLSSKFKKRKGRLFLKDYMGAGLIKPEDIDIRKLATEALADYYYRSSVKSLYDFANEQGLIQSASDELRKEGWLTAREIGITAPELKEKMVHPLLGSSFNELKAMRYRKGGLVRRTLGMIKIGQFVKPWIIWVYNTVQKYMRGMYSFNPVSEAEAATEAIKSILNQTELYHKLNESNLFQFPYEVSRASRDEQINMMLRRTIADKDSWNKAIIALEKATGTSWATQDVDIRKALMIFYQGIARATWTGDKIQRTQSYLMLRRMGYPHDEAVKVASKGHGAYSLLGKKYKEFWSPILFVYSFRVLMPMEMAKTALEPIIGIAEAAFKRQGIPKYKAKRWAKAVIGSIAIPVLVDQYMQSRGFKKEGAHLGPLAWKYKKIILDPDTGKESDIIVGMNYILNMPVKYWQRMTYYNPIRPEARWQQSLEHLIKWEVHPLWRIFYWDIADNRKSFGTGVQVYNTEDTPLEQAGQIAKYVFGQSLRFWGGMMDAVGEGSMTDKERTDQETIFEEGLTKLDRVLFSVLGYKYTRANLDERKAIMGKFLLKEIKSRQFNIARKYEGEEKNKRIADLEKWARRCQKWIETEMK